jgi:type I restriction enzyme S subunit
MSHHADRAFAVHWSEVKRWSPGSFREMAWSWSPDVIRPLATALRRRIEAVDRKAHPLDSLTFGSLHFSGELSIRDMSSKQEVKGKLCFAHANDVVYSKIDARNGAIGIVPTSLPLVVFSSEYPIYEVVPAVALPEYVKLLFRMNSFRERINSLISGASGRKRVEPGTLESIEVPLPPLATQQVIVDYWRATEKKNATVLRAAEEHEASSKDVFLKHLGLSYSKAGIKPRVFGARWSTVDAWTCSAIHLKLSQSDLTKGNFPVVTGHDILLSVQHGCSVGPSVAPTSLEVLKISAATRGEYDRTQK